MPLLLQINKIFLGVVPKILISSQQKKRPVSHQKTDNKTGRYYRHAREESQSKTPAEKGQKNILKKS
jgi:hypothetical protein